MWSRAFHAMCAPRRPRYVPAIERLEARTAPTVSWNNFNGNAQHTGVSPVPAQPIDHVLWSTPLDLEPWGEAHFGDPVFTPGDTVIVPTKVTYSGRTQGANDFFVEGLNGATGAAVWTSAQTGRITAASNTSPIVITSPNHALATGTSVTIGGVLGNSNADGTFTVTVLDANSFALNGSTGSGAYNDGGTWVYSPTNAGYIAPAYRWLPPYQPAYDPVTNRAYFPGPGGTLEYVSNPDSPGSSTPTPVQIAFYGTANYTANKAAYNASIFINTPLTVDSAGNVYFGFTVTGTNPSGITDGGLARITPTGTTTYTLAYSVVGQSNDGNWNPAMGSAPAISNDGSILYVGINDSGYALGGSEYNSYLVGLNSTTLAPVYRVPLLDPASGRGAGLIDESSASPMVAPDGTVFMGVFGNPSNGSRGFLLHFSGNLQTPYAPGAFGWDDTASLVPTSMVPSYKGTSPFLILSKYNNYANAEVGLTYGGNGVDQIAILDPYATQLDPNYDYTANLQVMRQVMTYASPSPDLDNVSGGDPDAVREWCTNGTAIDPATDSAFINNEDGYTYQWNLGTGLITNAVEITTGIGVPYTPTAISPHGEIFSDNGGTLFALGGYAPDAISTVSSADPAMVGNSITFTTTVTPTAAGSTPTGSVTYSYTAGANTPLNSTPIPLGTVPLVNGVATLTVSGWAAAHYHVVASYSGDATYPKGKTTLVQPVLETVTTGVTASANGSSVTYTATVTPNGTSFVPLGTVTIMDGSTVLGTALLNSLNSLTNPPSSNQATFTTSNPPGGTDVITAVYSGDQNFVGGTGAAATATHFRVSAAANATAGTAFNVTVTALDVANNTVAGYSGLVHFTSSDGQATLPADAALVNGTGAFSATLKTAGAQSVTATDTVTTSLTGSSAGMSVAPAAANHLAFGQQPTGGLVGNAITPAVTVQLLDPYNNVVTTDNSHQVSLALGTNPGAATLGGTVIATVSGGVATFSDLSLNRPGTGYTLVASSSALTGATSTAFNATAPAGAANFVKTDTTTLGSWQGAYGGDGYSIAQGAASLPAYAQLSFTGPSNFTWAATTTDLRALVKPAASDRLAACWYAATSFSMDLNLIDGQAHQVGLYLLDWDKYLGGRTEHVDVMDANTNTVLDTRTVNGFSGGQYLVWTITGHVLIKVTNAGGAFSNAVVSGLFFGTVAAGPQADLSITKTDNVTSVAPGAPVTYTIVVSNAGPQAVTGATIADSMPVALTGVNYSAAGAGGASGFSNGSGSISQAVNLPVGASVTYTVTATVSASATGTLSNGATVTAPAGTTDPNPANNSANDTDVISSGGVPASVTFMRTDTTAQGTWQGDYGADGYALAQGAASLPSYATVTPSGQGNYTWASSTTDVRALQKPGASDRLAACWYAGTSYTLDVNLIGAQSHQVALYLLDWDTFLGGRTERVDLLDANTSAVLDTRTVSSFSGGRYLVWTVSGHVLFRVTNSGIASSNAVASALFFGPGGSVSPQADLSITNTDNVTTVSPGGAVTYTMVVSNAGPSAVTGATVSDPMPAGLTGVAYTAAGAGGASGFTSGSGNISQVVNLPAGASITYTTTATVSSFATGTLSNTAAVTTPAGVTDPNLANNTATDTDTISGGGVPAGATIVQADTSTQGRWQGAYGGDGYAIAQGAVSLPAYAQLGSSGQSNYTWASSTSDARALQKPGASDRLAACWYAPTSYALDLALTDTQPHQVALYLLDWDKYLGGRTERVDVLDASTSAVLDTRTASAFSGGEYLVWQITGHVLLRVTNTGLASSNAVASALFFGAASLGPQADLSITNTDGTATVAPGAPLTYTIVVTNNGPSAVNGAAVADTMPAALTGVSYSAVGSGGASGFSNGSGSINQAVNLPVGASVTYTVTASVLSSATGSLVNAATVTAPAGVTDPNLVNNSATDTDTISGGGEPTSVTFVRTDATTQGTWQGAYGADGYAIAQGAASLPSYGQLTPSGQGNYTWASSTTDLRALQKPGALDRLAACWYAPTSFTLDLTITGGQVHQVALYLLDWDKFLGGRSERVDVLDGNNPNTVLDTRTVTTFSGGEYLVWTITGHVLLRVTNAGVSSSNAVASALFFAPLGSPQLAAHGQGRSDLGSPRLTAGALSAILTAAVDRWVATGLSAGGIQRLRGVSAEVVDLPDGDLGRAPLGGSLIYLDVNAAGYGWFIDPTPMDDGEFPFTTHTGLHAGAGTSAADHMDLLTVVMHELGHVLGLDSVYGGDPTDLMNAFLDTGDRRLPGQAAGDGLWASPDGWFTAVDLEGMQRRRPWETDTEGAFLPSPIT